MIGARLVGSTYAERWLVVDAIVKGHDVRQITFDCDPRRPRVELPAVGDRVRSGVHAAARRDRRRAQQRSQDSPARSKYKKYRAFQIERKAVYTFHARGRPTGGGATAFSRRRRSPPHAAFRGPGHERRHEGRRQSRLEAGGCPQGSGARGHPRHLRSGTSPCGSSDGRSIAAARRGDIMPTNTLIAAARDLLFAGLDLSGRVPRLHRTRRLSPPPKSAPKRADGKRPRQADRADDAAAGGRARCLALHFWTRI